MKRFSTLLPLCGLLLCCLLSSCTTVPITNCKTASCGASNRQAASAAAGYQRLLLANRLDNNTPEGIRLQQVAVRVIGAAGRYYQQEGRAEQFNRYRWEINLLSGEAAALLALPGGKIAANTGLLRAVGSDDQLAFLVGRSVGHVLACHQPGRSRFAPKGPMDSYQFARMETVEQVAAGRSAYGRKATEEADHIGLFLAAAAGYDPKQCIQIAENHPERAQSLAALLPQITADAQAYPPDEPYTFAGGGGSSGLVRSIEQAKGDTLSFQEKWDKVLRTVPLPASGSILLIHVKSVSSFSAQMEQFAALRDLGDFFLEEATVEGASYQRVLLGTFSTSEEASKRLAEVQKRGFKEAFLIDYKDGKRGKRRY
ncbi:MAG: M48 family metalloprotease [Saprospiraceae bacterium]